MTPGSFAPRRFLRVALVASSAFGAVVALGAGPAGNADAMILRAVGGACVGLLISGCLYLVLVSKDLASLHIPFEELNESEIVLLKSAGSMVHYRTGRPLRFWEGIGGRLFLTNQTIEFRAHRGQPWVYRLTIPLADVAQASTYKGSGVVSGRSAH
jgi:hypothetical protein